MSKRHILFLFTKPRLSQARALLFPKVFVNTNIKNTMDLSIVDEQVVKNNSIVFKAIAAVIIISILTYTVAKCSSDSTEANKTSLINDSIQAR